MLLERKGWHKLLQEVKAEVEEKAKKDEAAAKAKIEASVETATKEVCTITRVMEQFETDQQAFLEMVNRSMTAYNMREKAIDCAPYEPVGPLEGFFPGTWYLTGTDAMHRRSYERVPAKTETNGHA